MIEIETTLYQRCEVLTQDTCREKNHLVYCAAVEYQL